MGRVARREPLSDEGAVGLHTRLARRCGSPREVGGGIVEHRRERARGPEEVPRQVERQLLGVGIQQQQRRRHGGEDAGKEDGHLQDGAEGEVVLHPDAVGGGQIPDAREQQQQPLLQPHGPARRPEAPMLAAGHNDQHDEAKQREVALPLDAERLVLHSLLEGVDRERGRLFLVDDRLVEQVEDDEQRAIHQQPGEPEREGPSEGNALEEAEVERRVAERGEQTSAVGDDEDEEDDDVGAGDPLLVGAEQRPNEDHRGPGRADHVGKQRADGEHRGVGERCAGQAASHIDAAAQQVEAQNERDEGEVLHAGMHELKLPAIAEGVDEPAGEGERDEPHQHPAVAVALPPVGHQRRHERDEEEDDNEGDRGPVGELRRDLCGGHEHARRLQKKRRTAERTADDCGAVPAGLG